MILASCTGGRVVEPVPRARVPDEAPFLLDPARGYAPRIGPGAAQELTAAHRALVDSGDVARALAASASLLQRNADLAPAVVLEAQARLVAGESASVLELLRPLVAKLPEYDAGLLVFGRAAELEERPVDALTAYGTLADRSQVAAGRLLVVKPPAIRTLANRVTEALGRRRLDDASESLKILQQWAPKAMETLRATAVVAAAREDPVAELQALRGLRAAGPMERELLLRTAHLELEVGDAGAGLRVFQDLSAAHPGDSRLAAELARAKFLWRLELLPEKIKQLTDVPEMRRGELAAMLYWLFPSIRYGQPGAGKIANDVLDHPHRQEIVRVANLGVMSVDPRLHRFEPDRLLSRSATLVSILRVLAIQRPVPACLAGLDLSSRMSSGLACDLATRCELLREDGDCLADAGASGRAALEWIRLALDQLGAR